jgi:predicted signal transduction protein with EAL and GGDEF domain
MISSLGSLFGGIGHNHVIMGIDDFLARGSVMYVFTFIYMVFHVSIPLCFYLYVRTVLGIDLTRVSDVLVTFTPMALAYTALALTPINDGIFYFDDGIYHRGEYMWVFYLVAIWYTVVAINNIVLYRSNIRLSVLLSFFSFVILAILGVIMQFMNSHVKVENFFNAVVLLMLYITIERPGDYIDSATGLQNDHAFYVNASIRIKRGREARIVALSIDNAEFLNNSIGYEATTELIEQVAYFLDSLTKSAVTYRMNRDTFVVMIKEGAKITHIEIMEAIRNRFTAPFTTNRYSVVLFDCMMYVNWPDDVKNTEELSRMLTIFESKAGHRMKHEVLASSIDLEQDVRKKVVDSLLRTAISDERIAFKYQPVKTVATGLFDSVELKPMLESAELGMVAPGEYFELAEENGTAVPIAKHIIEVCFEYMKDCGMAGREINEFAMPLPNAFLLMRSAAEWVIEKAIEYSVDPAYVTFELSERTLVDYTYALEENMHALNTAGFSFMLMDYGNGYTDAEMMLEMHLKEVCLNRDLLSSAPMSDKADTLVKCAVDMMKNLSIGIKASGVDSAELEEYAVKVGVDKVQGFQLARFQSGADLIGFIKGRRENGAGLLL